MTKQLDHEDWAIIDHTRERTVRILDFTNKSEGGTGVKIRLKERYFIATAAHVIPDSHDIRVLVRGSENRFVCQFIDWKTDKEVDIGLLELCPDDAESLGGEFVEDSGIVIDFPLDEKWSVLLCGYPGQLIGISEQRKENVRERSFDFRSMACFTGTIPRNEWPTESVSRPLAQDAELFVRFDSDVELEQIDFREPTPRLKQAHLGTYEPAGMSGGGIWGDSRPREDKLWTPETPLLGIATSVHKKGGWMRGTRIAHWVKLAGFPTS